MKPTSTIKVTSVKSNKSNRKVWLVAADKEKKQYCRNARTALRYAFILKKETGKQLSDRDFAWLMFEIGRRRKPQAGQETAETAEAQGTVEAVEAQETATNQETQEAA